MALKHSRPFTLRRIGSSLVMLTLVTMMMPITTMAWGEEGHKITALIAFRLLNPRARTQVLLVLQGRTITTVAVWPDDLRRAGEGCVVPKAGCNPNYRPETSQWHFVDMSITGDGKYSADDCPPSRYGDCIIPAIEDFRGILDKATNRAFAKNGDEQKRKLHDALSFIVHFLGDIHQPLHCADNHDAGGNGVLVTWKDEPKYTWDTIWNLHSVWDEYLVTRNIMKMPPPKRTYSKYADSLLNSLSAQERNYATLKSPTIETGRAENTIAWAESSHALAKSSTYKLPSNTVKKSTRGFEKLKDGKPLDIVVLDEDYFKANMPEVEKQLRLGGVRLAHILNEIYDKDIP
jgi:hypothetical protein